MENNSLKQQRDYVWDYFQLHATQRMTTFNFFVVLAGLLTVGLSKSLVDNSGLNFFSLFLGIALMVVPLAFWKLDIRVRNMIHHAERKLKDIEKMEKENNEWKATIFTDDGTYYKASYTTYFSVLYLTFALLGFIGAVYSIRAYMCFSM